MILVQIRADGDRNFAYIFGDEQNRGAAVVDPGSDIGDILEQLQMLKINVEYIFNSHSHWDHCAGNDQIKQITGARVVMHAMASRPKDVSVKDGDQIKIGRLSVKVIHTPGHTPDSICLLVDGKLFTGDTLFVGECGRTDFPGGSSIDMYYSLFNKILLLDDDVKVFPGHDYGEMPSSTIGHERSTNYTLEKRTLEEFIEFMRE